MVENNLINDMSYDLNIEPYLDENQEAFINRLIYSGISLWMKKIILDQPIFKTDDKNEDILKTKNYHSAKSIQILSYFIDLFPTAKDYFFPEENFEPIQYIRALMTDCGEINEITIKEEGNQRTRLALPISKIVPIDDSISRVIGVAEQFDDSLLEHISNREYIYSGVSLTVSNFSTEEEKVELFIDNPTNFVRKFNDISFLEPISSLDFDFEIYNVRKSYSYEKNWINSKKLVYELSLIRELVGKNYYKYSLLYKKNNELYRWRVKEELIIYGAHTRIKLGLKQMYGHPARGKYKLSSNVVILQINVEIPIVEEVYIKTYSWPKNSIKDRFNYIIPIGIWPFIKSILSELNYILEETNGSE